MSWAVAVVFATTLAVLDARRESGRFWQTVKRWIALLVLLDVAVSCAVLWAAQMLLADPQSVTAQFVATSAALVASQASRLPLLKVNARLTSVRRFLLETIGCLASAHQALWTATTVVRAAELLGLRRVSSIANFALTDASRRGSKAAEVSLAPFAVANLSRRPRMEALVDALLDAGCVDALFEIVKLAEAQEIATTSHDTGVRLHTVPSAPEMRERAP